MSRKRVLVADDFIPVLESVAELLKESSFDVVALVSDGCAALETTLNLKPDLVVMDISMPGMSGIEVARELKRRGNNTTIVFLTLYEDSDITAACLAAGGLGYVVKIRMDTDLVPAINEALVGRIFVSAFSTPQDRH